MEKLPVVMSAVVVMLLSAIIVLSYVPPVGRDDLAHHLAVPKLYIRNGGICEIPSIIFSYYPMNLDLLYLIPLSFGNDIAPKFVHFGFGLLTAWLIFRYLRHRTNLTYALIGVIFFLSVPIIVKLSINAYVDLGLVFFSFAALMLIPKWIETGFRMKYLILSAIFCGLAMGTKYNGLIIFFLLTLFVPYLCSGHIENKMADIANCVRSGVVYCIVALLIFSPWMIRNWHWKGNPIYPLYDNLFHPPAKSEKPEGTARKEKGGIFTLRGIIYGESGWEMALLPIRIFFQGEDGNAKYFDGKLNPFLLILPIFAFWGHPREDIRIRREKKILLAFSLLFFIFTFFSTVLRARYLTPMLPPLVILSVFGSKNLAERIGKKAMCVIVSGFLMLNAVYVVEQFGYVRPFEYLEGKISRDDYVVRYRPEYAAMRYINGHVPNDAVILFLFTGNRGYYCDRKYVFDSLTNTSASMLAGLVRNADRPDKILSELRKKGITHFLIHADLFERWLTEEFSSEEEVRLGVFLQRYVSKLFLEKGYAVLKVEYPNV